MLFLFDWDDLNEFGVFEGSGEATNTLVGEFDDTFYNGEKGVVFAAKNAMTWTDFCAALTDENVTDTSVLAGIFFYSKTLAVGITTVRGRTTCFFMSHTKSKRLREWPKVYVGTQSLSSDLSSRRMRGISSFFLSTMPKTKEELRTDVENVLQVLRQGLAMHGGNVELVDVDPEVGSVSLRLQGACVGCPMSELTLRSGIEETLKEMVPEVKEVINMDDLEASGIDAEHPHVDA